jgi:hypothetical protein
MNYYTGLYDKLSYLGLNTDNVFLACGFYSGNKNNNIIYPDDWSRPFSASGELISSNPNSFYFTGSGFFNGNTNIKINKPFEIDNSIIFISYEKLNNNDEILLSSVAGNTFSNYSGYCLGVNQANKLYFKYWNPIEGPFAFTFENIISDKNFIYVYKNLNALTIGQFNNNTLEFETKSFSIFNNAFRDSNQLFLGGNSTSNNIPWVSANNFSGYIDKFYILKNTSVFYANELGVSLFSNSDYVSTGIEVNCIETGFPVFSGFSYTGITGIFPSGFIIESTGITGYVNILSGFSYTGVTGFQQNIIGSFVDNCGIPGNIYESIPLTGTVTGNLNILSGLSGIIRSTGIVNINLTGTITGQSLIFITGELCTTGENFDLVLDYYKDENFLRSLSYSSVSLLKENLINGDIVEVFTENYVLTGLDYNTDLEKISIDQYYLNSRLYNSGDFILYKNGQALINNNRLIVQSGYEILVEPVNDYYISGDRIYLKEFNENDYVFYDNITGNYSARLLTGNILSLPPGLTIGNKLFIFKNGQKLIPLRDYTPLTSNIFSLINTPPDQENNIMIKQYFNNFNYVSGGSGYMQITGKFNHKCSQVYYNGIKQKIFNNYVENSNLDLISGNFYYSLGTFRILNNLDNFFINL